MESVTVVTEPLLHRDFVQFEIVVPILERLRGKYDITLAAPKVATGVQQELEEKGVRVVDGGAYFPPIRRSRDEIPSYVASWMRDATFGWNRRDIERALNGLDGMRFNVSMTIAIDADVWLIQSRPLGQGVAAMRHSVNRPLRVAMTAALPFVWGLDLHHLLDVGRRAGVRYSTTRHVGDWFGSQGLPVAGIVPVYYRPTIYQSTQNPSRDYLLVYVGKETDTAAVRMLLDTGLPVTMFGSKSVGWVKSSLRLERYPNARLLGYVTDAQLRDLYSNARFTAFPFTEEPFGLVPLESMACGTPILTYGEQGPAESVLDGRTGWLVHSREEFAQRAVELWNSGTPSSWMVDQCLARARGYHIDTVSAGWSSLIESGLARHGARMRTARPGRLPWSTPTMEITVPAPNLTRAYTFIGAKSPSGPSNDTVLPLLPTVAAGESHAPSSEMPIHPWRSPGRHRIPEPKGNPTSGPPTEEFDADSETASPDQISGRGSRGSLHLPGGSTEGSASSTP